MNKNNFIVLDLTNRLPGPLATFHLRKYGIKVIKIEDRDRPDPFKGSEEEALFKDWYKNLNSEKEIRTIPYKDLSKTLDEKIHLIITTLSEEKIREFCLQKITKKILVLKSNKSEDKVHDLNILSKLGILSAYIRFKTEDTLPPPFLPIAGISFSYEIALKALVMLHLEEEKTEIIYMEEALKESLTKLIPRNILQKAPRLHEGAYPCYHIYKLRDHHYVALAAIEEEFFRNFSNSFNLGLRIEDRFDTTGTILKKISEFFKTHTSLELKTKLDSNNFCLSLIQNPRGEL